MLYSDNGRGQPFRVDGSDVFLTKSAACAQKRAGASREQSGIGGKAPLIQDR